MSRPTQTIKVEGTTVGQFLGVTRGGNFTGSSSIYHDISNDTLVVAKKIGFERKLRLFMSICE